MSGLTIGSLFSGIGGLELGLERGIGNGCRTVWQVEQDEYCRAVLAKHWPEAKRYEDVRNVGRETLERVDIICGGFPCQDISQAGRGVGIRGERSGLFFEYVRILRELRPGYVVVENTSALLFRGLDVVLGELSAIGYDAEWEAIPAAAVGAPHLRDRVWILAYPGRQSRTRQREHHRPRRPDDRGAKASGRTQAERGQDRELVALVPGVSPGVAKDWWASQSRMDRTANGIPGWSHRVTALGNAVVPQVAEVVGRLIAEREKELRGAA